MEKKEVSAEVREAAEQLTPVLAESFATKEEINAGFDSLTKQVEELGKQISAAPGILHDEYKDDKNGEPKFLVAKALYWQLCHRSGFKPTPKDDRDARQLRVVEQFLPVYTQKALSSATDTAGGFLVPEEWESGVVQTLKEESVVLAMGPTIRETNRDVLNVPAFDAKKTFQWLAENTAANEGTPTTRNITLTPKKSIGLVQVSTEWLEDVDEQSDRDFRAEISGEYAEFLDLAFLEGSGSGNQPRGLRNISGINTFDAGGTITYNDFVNIERDLKVDSVRPPFVWIMHPQLAADTKKLVDSNGLPLFVAGPTFGSTLAPLGYQVFESAQIATDQGASSDETYLLLVKPREVIVARRRGIAVALSEHAAFSSDAIQLRMTSRFDINVFHAVSIGAVTGITAAA